MSYYKRIIAISFLFLFSLKSFAYELDTHFYLTYILSRHVGIKHEVALHFALGAQWIDESKKTTPMSGLPLKGSEMRRRYHFPNFTERVNASGHGLITGFVSRIKTFTETQPNHPIGSLLIDLGLTSGNWMMFSAGLHILQDTYGHAGFPAEIGHFDDGHIPDRAELEIDKYKVMIDRVIHALYAARSLLPHQALDRSFYSNDKLMNLSPSELSQDFVNKSGYIEMISDSGLQDNHYIHFAFLYLLKEMKKNGYIHPHVNLKTLLPSIESIPKGEQFTHGVMTDFLTPIVTKQVAFLKSTYNYSDQDGSVDFAKLEKDALSKNPNANGTIVFQFANLIKGVVPGQPIGWVSLEKIAENLAKDYALISSVGDDFRGQNLSLEEKRLLNVNSLSSIEKQEAGLRLLVYMSVLRMAQGRVPRPMNSTHKREFEDEGPIRQFEKWLKMAYVQKFIHDKYGSYIEFHEMKSGLLQKILLLTKDFGVRLAENLRIVEADEVTQQSRQKAPESIQVITMEKSLRRRFDRQVGGVVNYKAIIDVMRGKDPEVNPLTQAYQYPELFKRLAEEGRYKPLILPIELDLMHMNSSPCDLVLNLHDWNLRTQARSAAGL